MKVVLFWSEYGGETILSEWLKREVYLSPSQLLTIQSHNKFGSEFELYSYQKIKNFSKTRDANDILPARIAFKGSTKLAFNFEDLPKDCLLYNEYKYINS